MQCKNFAARDLKNFAARDLNKQNDKENIGK